MSWRFFLKVKYGNIFKYFILIFILIVCIFPITAYYAIWKVDKLISSPLPKASFLFSEEGQEFYRFFKENRKFLEYDKIPEHVRRAFVCAEDERFFDHHGIDMYGIGRAFYKNIKHLIYCVVNKKDFDFIEGASGITQQLVRTVFYSIDQKTLIDKLFRKLKEAYFAWVVDYWYSKKTILALYMNVTYLGRGAYGVAVASEKYFGKNINDISINEAAYLAALPKKPSYYDKNYQDALIRKNYVIGQMVENGYIPKELHKYAYSVSPKVIKLKGVQPSHFSEKMRNMIRQKYNKEWLYKGGLQIRTSIKYKFQKHAQKIMNEMLDDVDKKNTKKGFVESAMVCIDNQTGQVLAYIGGRDYNVHQTDKADNKHPRQVGSVSKTFLYGYSFDQGKLSLSNSLFDAQRNYSGWPVRNYGGYSCNCYVSVERAFYKSLNTVMPDILLSVGIDDFIDFLNDKLFISSKIQDDLTISLGTYSASLLEMTNAYVSIANKGLIYKKPVFILSVKDSDGNVFEERTTGIQEKAFSKSSANAVKYMMRKVVLNGTGKAAQIKGLKVYGKTGTTDECRDAYFIGFVEGQGKSITIGVWVGYEKEHNLGRYGTGGHVAAPIWREIAKWYFSNY